MNKLHTQLCFIKEKCVVMMIILIASRLEMFYSQEYYKTTTSEECASYVSFKIGQTEMNKKVRSCRMNV